MNFKNKFLLFICFSSLLFSFFVCFDYSGNKILYILFTLISLFYLTFLLRKKSIFFDNFIGIFLWIGIWFNFSLKVKLKTLFPNGIGDFKYWFSDGVGMFDFSSVAYNKIVIISCISYLAIIIASFLREFCFSYSNNNYDQIEIKFYKKNRTKIILFFLILFILITYFNFDQKIFQRGMIADGDVTLRLLFNFMFTIFFPSLICVILNYEFKIGKSLKTAIFLSLFESIFNSISILSRNSIFNPTSNLFGIIKINSFTKKYNKLILTSFFLLIVFSFIFVVTTVSSLRIESNIANFNSKFNQEKSEVLQNNSSYMSSLSKIFISRLIGIEGIMAVSSSDKLGIDLIKSAFKEEYVQNKESFYDSFKNEIRKQQICEKKKVSLKKCKVNSISLMGIIAFLFYSGSYLFLFTMLIIICLMCSGIEFIALRFTNNLIFTAFIGQILAYRLWHFGYLPMNSYKLIFSILLMVFIIFLFRSILRRICKE
ncbi:hypothetical protein IDH14_04875 [Pelagibacterales bacterium SAG-MED33]|nr:hypothetical protein [Pelagibacterales bacterium SAG-MED33]